MNQSENNLDTLEKQLELVKRDLCKGEFAKVNGQLIRKDGCPTCSHRDLCRSRRLTKTVFI